MKWNRTGGLLAATSRRAEVCGDSDKKTEGRELSPTLNCLRSQCYRLRLQKPERSEALEAYDLTSSRLANEAACTTTRYIQASPHLLAPRALNFVANLTE